MWVIHLISARLFCQLKNLQSELRDKWEMHKAFELVQYKRDIVR